MSALRDLQLDLKDPGLIEALHQIALMEHTLEALEAQRRQEQIGRELREARCVNGLGQMTLMIDTFAMHDWWFKEGPQVHMDKTWRRYMREHAPETNVKVVRSKPGIGYRAAGRGPEAGIHTPWQGERRFVKVYRTAPALSTAAHCPDPMAKSQ
jgi:hypothetical protein